MRLLMLMMVMGGGALAHYGEMLSPRFYPGTAVGGLLARAGEQCQLPNSHTCLEVNATESCCENTQFCLINLSFQAACCPLGSDCGNLCSTDAYICKSTITVSGTPTITRACCPRSCSGTLYKCAATLGGNCCPFGSDCQSDGKCIAPSTSSGPATTAIPSGCTSNQFACATGQGGGCCDNGMRCTVSDNTNYCAMSAGTSLVTRTGTSGIHATAVPDDPPNKGLSTGAKAGIGVGVSLGVLLIIGALLYFFVIHRHESAERESQRREGSQPMSQPAGSTVGGGGSEQNGSKLGVTKRPTVPRENSQPSDYFGPSAVPGPFTDRNSAIPGGSPGYDRGVPAHPQSPGDIASPVEIDSNLASPNRDYPSVPGTVEHRVELP